MFYTFDLVTVGLWFCCCSQAEEMPGVILTECQSLGIFSGETCISKGVSIRKGKHKYSIIILSLLSGIVFCLRYK